MSIKSIIGFFGVCLICVGNTTTHAAIVTMSFSGEITRNGDDQIGIELVPGINVGDLVTGTVIYDTKTSPVDVGWATAYSLTSPIDLLKIEVNGLTFSSTIGSNLNAYVMNNRSGYGDTVFIEDVNTNNDSVFNIYIRDEVPPFDLISDESLPTYLDFSKAEELNPDELGGNHGLIQTQGLTGVDPLQSANFSIDSFSMTVVPIPSAVWLFGSGLIGLIGMARRKKA